MLRGLVTIFWTLSWPVVAFFCVGFALMGDPVEGAYEQRKIYGRALLLVAAVIYLLGYWLIFRKRAR